MPLPPVSLAVVNARVWTGDPRRPWADAIVVRGDRIAFVGSAAEARKLTRDAPHVRVVDAGGQFVASDASSLGVLRAGQAAEFIIVDRDLTQTDVGRGEARIVFAVRNGQVSDSSGTDPRTSPVSGDAP